RIKDHRASGRLGDKADQFADFGLMEIDRPQPVVRGLQGGSGKQEQGEPAGAQELQVPTTRVRGRSVKSVVVSGARVFAARACSETRRFCTWPSRSRENDTSVAPFIKLPRLCSALRSSSGMPLTAVTISPVRKPSWMNSLMRTPGLSW